MLPNIESQSPARTTLLGTIFSPVFHFFTSTGKDGKYSLNLSYFIGIKMLIAAHQNSLGIGQLFRQKGNIPFTAPENLGI